MPYVVVQPPSTQAQRLSDIDTGDRPNEDGNQPSDEKDEERSVGRQKRASSASSYNMQPEYPISEGLILIHLHLMIVYM